MKSPAINPVPTTGPLLLPIPDACQRLGIQRTKLYALLGEGAIEARKIGRRTVVTAASVDRFAAASPVATFGAKNAA